MLHSYRNTSYSAYIIHRNMSFAVAHFSGYRTGGWYRIDCCPQFRNPRSYRNCGQSRADQQTAIGRVRAALVAALGDGQRQFDHATIGSIARQILKCARHVRLDRDNPETHLAFSPDGISARNLRGRRSLAFGRFLRRKCADLLRGRLALTDQQVSRAGDAFPVVRKLGIDLQLAYGDEAFAIYDDAENGIETCMSGWDEDGNASKSRFVEHHLTANPEKIGVIYARHGEKLLLRTKLYHNDDGSLHFNRIYSRAIGPLSDNSGPDSRERLLRPTIEDWLRTRFPGKSLSSTCDCTLTHEAGEYLPYLDRQPSFDRLGESTIRIHPGGKYDASSSTGEDPSCDTRNTCCNCDCRVGDDETVWSDGGRPYCETCHGEIYTYDELDECGLHHDSAVSAYRTGYHGRRETITTHQDNTVETVEGDFWVRGDDAIVELSSGDWAELDNAVYTVDGDYELAEDCEQILDSGEYDLRANLVELSDGRWAYDDDTVETTDGSVELAEDCTPFTDDYGNEVYRLATADDVVQAS